MGSGQGSAARRAAPIELLGVYAKQCQVCGHVIPITDLSCTICQDANARNREAGRVGEDPDYEGEDEHGQD